MLIIKRLLNHLCRFGDDGQDLGAFHMVGHQHIAIGQFALQDFLGDGVGGLSSLTSKSNISETVTCNAFEIS
jgi:hypothetical protein